MSERIHRLLTCLTKKILTFSKIITNIKNNTTPCYMSKGAILMLGQKQLCYVIKVGPIYVGNYYGICMNFYDLNLNIRKGLNIISYAI